MSNRELSNLRTTLAARLWRMAILRFLHRFLRATGPRRKDSCRRCCSFSRFLGLTPLRAQKRLPPRGRLPIRRSSSWKAPTQMAPVRKSRRGFWFSRGRQLGVLSIQAWGSGLRRALVESGVFFEQAATSLWQRTTSLLRPAPPQSRSLAGRQMGRTEWKTEDGQTRKACRPRAAIEACQSTCARSL